MIIFLCEAQHIWPAFVEQIKLKEKGGGEGKKLPCITFLAFNQKDIYTLNIFRPGPVQLDLIFRDNGHLMDIPREPTQKEQN